MRAHRKDIRGRVLEVKESLYTERYGTDLTEQAVLDIDPANPEPTIVAHRILRPGGVLLVTVPTLSRLVSLDMDYWRFMSASCRYLFEPVFGVDRVEIRADGNVLAAIAFLTGMAADELKRSELETLDERFPLVVSARAVKA